MVTKYDDRNSRENTFFPVCITRNLALALIYNNVRTRFIILICLNFSAAFCLIFENLFKRFSHPIIPANLDL